MGCGSSNAAEPGIQRSAAEIMFRKYDTSGNNKLDKNEFKRLCQALGYNLTDEELALDMRMLDLNGDGNIGFAEFSKWWKSDQRFAQLQWRKDRLEILEELSNQFKAFDADGSGKLDRKEFAYIHKKLVEKKLTTVPADIAFERIDTSRDGKIDFAEYARFMLANKK